MMSKPILSFTYQSNDPHLTGVNNPFFFFKDNLITCMQQK